MSLYKTSTAFLLSVVILLTCFLPANATAENSVNCAVLDGYTSNINAVGVYDLTNEKTLYTKNATQRISIASTTKLMTSLVALNYIHPDKVLPVGSEVKLVQPNSSLCGLSASSGHTLKLRTLIAGMLLPSGNDAAYTVAVNTARIQSGNSSMSDTDAVKYFCSLMNDYAKKLGCKNTNFVNPEGWDNKNHYSTVEDMILIARAAAGNAIITSISCIQSQKFYFASGHNITWTNTNSLLDKDSRYYYPYAKGLKTGTTASAGKCLVALAEYNNRKILVLVYGAKEETDRFGSVVKIFNYLYFPPVLGDIDQNGEIAATDARIVLRASVGLEKITDIISKRGDVDADGKITASDARLILRASVGLESLTS